MAPAQRSLLERNIRPRKRTFDESEESDDASEIQQGQFSSDNSEQVEEDNDSDDSSLSDYENDDGKRLQTSRNSRAKLEFRGQQDAESGSRRGLDQSESEMEELDGWRSGSGGSGDEERENDNVQRGLDQISFGALKRAQESLASKYDSKEKKRRRESDGDVDEALRKLRKQLKEKDSKSSQQLAVPGKEKAGTRTANFAQGQSDDESDSDSAPSEEAAQTSRASKHAPMSQSSKRQVTRKRQVIDVPKIQSRDPRFDAINSASAQPNNTSQKAYSFIDDYQKAEIAELKTGLRKAKTAEDKEILRRKIVAMENRLKAKATKQREQDVVRQHRKEEKEKIQQGKKPYFLKKSEMKERALVERFKGMKGKEKEKVIEKRRRKEGQKEKKRMPMLRRGVGDA